MKRKTEACVRMHPDMDKINRCIAILDETSDSIKEISKIMQLAGNEARLKILYLIYREKRICVCDLSDILRMSVSAVSQHLRKLKHARLIADNKHGNLIFYSLNERCLETLLAVFIQIKANKFQLV